LEVFEELTHANIASITVVESGGTNAGKCAIQIQTLRVKFRTKSGSKIGTFVNVFMCQIILVIFIVKLYIPFCENWHIRMEGKSTQTIVKLNPILMNSRPICLALIYTIVSFLIITKQHFL
jgi:hypothetical protein